MKIDPYLTAILYGDGSVSLRKDGAYAIWIDQAEINRDIMVNEVIPRLRHLGSKVYVYRYYAKKDKTYKFRALIYSKQVYKSLKFIFNSIDTYLNELSNYEARTFIAGLMDAEGTVTDRIVIYNSNRKLLEAVRNKLIQMGFEYVYILQVWSNLRSPDL